MTQWEIVKKIIESGGDCEARLCEECPFIAEDCSDEALTLNRAREWLASHPEPKEPESTDKFPPLHIGDRVVRGPDWNWGEQDGHGEGTVISFKDNRQFDVEVSWDKTGGRMMYYYNPRRHDIIHTSKKKLLTMKEIAEEWRKMNPAITKIPHRFPSLSVAIPGVAEAIRRMERQFLSSYIGISFGLSNPLTQKRREIRSRLLSRI